MEIGAVMSTVCLLWQSWTRESEVSIPQCEVQQLDISERCADIVRNLLESQVPRPAVARVLAKTARFVETQKQVQCGQVGHRRPDCPRRNEKCSLCGKRGHFEPCVSIFWWERKCSGCRGGTAEPEEERHSHVSTVSFRHFWNPVGRFVCLRQHRSPSEESGNLLKYDHELWC